MITSKKLLIFWSFIAFILLMSFSTLLFAIEIDCIDKTGKKFYHNNTDRIYIDSLKHFIAVDNFSNIDVINADCTIHYEFEIVKELDKTPSPMKK